jgi:hypothetical protein
MKTHLQDNCVTAKLERDCLGQLHSSRIHFKTSGRSHVARSMIDPHELQGRRLRGSIRLRLVDRENKYKKREASA